MTVPCCFPEPGSVIGRYCNDYIDTATCEAVGGIAGPEGVCCANPVPPPRYLCPAGDSLCWRCEGEINPGPYPIYTNCCFWELGFQWLPRILIEQCLECEGQPAQWESDCTPEPEDAECIEARPDRPNPNLMEFTIDNVGTVVFSEGLGSIDDDRYREGYHYPISTHLTRPGLPSYPHEPCGHAVGRYVMLDDGYVYVETYSQPDLTNTDSCRPSYAILRTFLPEEETEASIQNQLCGTRNKGACMEKGYQYWVGCIQLPAWTEALYRSSRVLCRGIDV